MVSKSVVWPKGKTFATFTRKVTPHVKLILEGKMLAIDPSSKSMGWALYVASELQNSGVIEVKSPDVNKRLQEAYDCLQTLEIPDVLVIEEIRGAQSHDYLKYSVGVSMAAIRTPVAIAVPIVAWKAVCKTLPEYYKNDENDAKVIGYTTILRARDLDENV